MINIDTWRQATERQVTNTDMSKKTDKHAKSQTKRQSDGQGDRQTNVQEDRLTGQDCRARRQEDIKDAEKSRRWGNLTVLFCPLLRVVSISEAFLLLLFD